MGLSTYKSLKPTHQRFVDAFVRYGNRARAVRIAYPDDSKHWSDSYLNVKGARLMQNDAINTEIQNRKAVMEQNATLGAQRIQRVIKEGKEHNALAASIFSVEQADGKAAQTTTVKSQHVVQVMDLSGGQAGEVPEHIKRELGMIEG